MSKKKLKNLREHNAQASSRQWAMYEHFVPFVEEYLKALKEYPDAEIYISR